MTSYDQVKRDAGAGARTGGGWVLGFVLLSCAVEIVARIFGS